MQTRTLFAPSQPGRWARSQFTTLDERVLDAGESLPLQRLAEERLYVFTDGRGLMDIYPGDALCYPPGIVRKITNDTDAPLTYLCHSAGLAST